MSTKLNLLSVIIGAFFFITSCSTVPPNYLVKSKSIQEIKATENRLEKVYYMVLGHFTNEEQAKTETSPIYVAQEVINVPIWTKRSGEYWVYISWMQQGKHDILLTQEVWELKRKDPETISLTIYGVPNKEKYTYDWKKENPLADLNPKDLISREKCTIDITREKQDFFVAKSHPCERNLSEVIKYVNMIADFTPNKVVFYSEMMSQDKKVIYAFDKGLQFVRVDKSKPRY